LDVFYSIGYKYLYLFICDIISIYTRAGKQSNDVEMNVYKIGLIQLAKELKRWIDRETSEFFHSTSGKLCNVMLVILCTFTIPLLHNI
jgi:hypothetical protein